MKCWSFFSANTHLSSAENLTYTAQKSASARRALLPTVSVHSLGMGHKLLFFFLIFLIFGQQLELHRYCQDEQLIAVTTPAEGMRVCFYTYSALIYQEFHMFTNCTAVQGALNTLASMLGYLLVYKSVLALDLSSPAAATQILQLAAW